MSIDFPSPGSIVLIVVKRLGSSSVNVEYTNITHILCKINRKYTATNHVITAKQKASTQ
jgi:hypothetical protein